MIKMGLYGAMAAMLCLAISQPAWGEESGEPIPLPSLPPEPQPTPAMVTQGIDANGVMRLICHNGVVPRVHFDSVGNITTVECPPVGECIPGWVPVLEPLQDGTTIRCVNGAAVK